MRWICLPLVLTWGLFFIDAAHGADGAAQHVGKLPHLEFDTEHHWARVECEALDTDAPLEFFCCKTGTNEYESVLRSDVTPSDLHTALLAIGLKPGSPVSYSEALKKVIPPHGPPLRITVDFQKDGKTISMPAQRFMRDLKTKKEPPRFSWIFAGSRIMPDGRYAADMTGYIVSIVNFDLTMIDISELASSANETLEWERNPDVAPKGGTKVWMTIEPLGADALAAPPDAAAPATQPADTDAAPPTTAPASLSDVHIDQAKVDNLQQYWDAKVAPHARALREAAEAHYQVISDLRREQQRLIDEADRIQRTIDKLDKEYESMTTPHPEPGS
jgi:hypothetical protein